MFDTYAHKDGRYETIKYDTETHLYTINYFDRFYQIPSELIENSLDWIRKPCICEKYGELSVDIIHGIPYCSLCKRKLTYSS